MIAAGFDDLERLTEAGFLRSSESGGFDWVSDSLAEQIFCRALCRRDPEISEASLTNWLNKENTSRLDSALVMLGVRFFYSTPQNLKVFLSDANFEPYEQTKNRRILARIIVGAAPLGRELKINGEKGRYKQ